MMNRVIQRSGFPLLFFAAAVLAAAVGIVLLAHHPLTEGLFRGGFVSDTDADAGSAGSVEQPPADDQPSRTESRDLPRGVPTPVNTAEPIDIDATAPAAAWATTTHVVVRGDTLFDLAGAYWRDPYLWPVLLVANLETITDPDYLRQGSVLNIPLRPETTDRAVTDAHIGAYRRYRELGDGALSQGRTQGNLWLIQLGLLRLNKAHWVLYSGLRYDDGLIERAEGAVPREDLEIVRGFVTRFGDVPGM